MSRSSGPPATLPRMRIDVVTIFPPYLAPLELSLIGKARADGLLDVRIWDLRDFTEDRHRSVDDTPYGGGAGMVMLAEPWGRALDAIGANADREPCESRDPEASDEFGEPLIVFPSPGGEPFSQRIAADLATQPWLVFCCGRYEGIDERVVSYAQRHHPGRVRTLSLGDYVLNGGEVAALAMIEAVARLVPGVIGNAASLSEESHADGLLEYPVFTRPPSWRGLDVPPVLLSGNHDATARWRREQQLTRTVIRRPDLLPPRALIHLGGAGPAGGDLPQDVVLRPATPADAADLLVMQRACWVDEGRVNDSWSIPPLVESFDEVREGLADWRTWLLVGHSRLIGGVRAALHGSTWHIGRLMVAPDLRRRGLGRWLLAYAEDQAPGEATRCALMTGAASRDNLRMYRRAGYRPVPEQREAGVVFLSKPRR